MSRLTANPVWSWLSRGESLDNLDAGSSSWRSSWTPRSNSYVPNYTQPPSAFSGSTLNYGGGGSGLQRPSTLPSSFSVSHVQGRAGTPSSQPSPSSPLSPTRSPEPRNNAGDALQRNRYNYSAVLLNNPNRLPPVEFPTGILLFGCCETRTLTVEKVEPELFNRSPL